SVDRRLVHFDDLCGVDDLDREAPGAESPELRLHVDGPSDECYPGPELTRREDRARNRVGGREVSAHGIDGDRCLHAMDLPGGSTATGAAPGRRGRRR